MPKRIRKVLPSHRFCGKHGKDLYPDEVGAQMALEYLSAHPKRGYPEPKRFYRCDTGRGFHLTSEDKRTPAGESTAA